MRDNLWKLGCKSKVIGSSFSPVLDHEFTWNPIECRIYFDVIKNLGIHSSNQFRKLYTDDWPMAGLKEMKVFENKNKNTWL